MIETIYEISLAFYGISLIAGIILFNKLDFTARLLVLFLAIELSVEIISHILSQNRISNLWVYNSYLLLESFIFVFIFMKFIINKSFRVAGLSLATCFLITWLYYTFLQAEPKLLHPVVMVVHAIVMISLSGFVLLYISTTRQNLFHDYRFWFSTAIFIYFITTLFVSAISSVLTAPGNQHLANLWIINSIANMFSHVLFIIFFIWNSRRKTLSF